MAEPFYTPPIPPMKTTSRRGTGGYYQFRQPQTGVNPLSARRAELQNVMSQRREEIAAGHQELEAMREMARLEQQEYAIRQQIQKERQVSSAQREIAQLDPEKDPQWRQKYAEVMSKHPYAQDNKFLNENFIQLGRVNQRVLEAGYRSMEEEQKQSGRMALKKEDAQRDFNKFAAHAAALHVNADDYRSAETGEIDWGGYVGALDTAQKSAKDAAKATAAEAGLPVKKIVEQEGKPPQITYEAGKAAASDIPAAIRSAYAKATVAAEALDARAKETQRYLDAPETAEKDKAGLRTSLSQIQADQQKAQIEKAAHEKAFPGLVNPAVNPPAAPAPTPAPSTPSAPAAPAPVSGGTATPSGTMDPLGATAQATPPATPANRPALKDLLPY